jgi:hypothetical protein
VATNSALVRAGVTGVASSGPTTATAPTSSSAALTGFADLGYLSDAGVTEARARSTNDIRGWQGGVIVRSLVTEGSLTYNFVMLETSKATIELFFGTSVTQTAPEGTLIVIPTSTGGRKSFVLDVVDGVELIRTYVPQGEVTEVGDTVFSNGEAIGYECTLTAYPDSSLAGGGCAKKFMTALKT